MMYAFISQPNAKTLKAQHKERIKHLSDNFLKNNNNKKYNLALHNLISYDDNKVILGSGSNGLIARIRLLSKKNTSELPYSKDSICSAYSLPDIIHIHHISNELTFLRIRNSFPLYNFRLYYGISFDEWPFFGSDTIETSAHTLKEKLNSAISFKEYIINNPFILFKEKFYQVLLALNTAHYNFNFTHYSLSLDDISLYKIANDETKHSLVYTLDGTNSKYLSVTDGYIACIDNFVNSYIKTKNIELVPSAVQEGDFPVGPYPLYDIYSFLMSVYKYAAKKNLEDYVDELMPLLAPFMITLENIDSAPLFLNWSNFEAVNVTYIDYFIKIGGMNSLNNSSAKKILCGIDSPVCRAVSDTSHAVNIPIIDNFYDFKDVVEHNNEDFVKYVVNNKLDYEKCVKIFISEVKKYDVNIENIETEDEYIKAWNNVRSLKHVLDVAHFFHKHSLMVDEEKYSKRKSRIITGMDINRLKWKTLVDLKYNIDFKSEKFVKFIDEYSIY